MVRVVLLISLLLLPISSYAKTVIIRVDNSFSKEHKIMISQACNRWWRLSGKIGFKLWHTEMNITEQKTWRYDNVSTIYSGKAQWQKDLLKDKGCVHSKNECMAITIRGANFQSADIFVGMDKRKFLCMMVHEIGHILGLGHSKNEKDVMYKKIDEKCKFTKNDKRMIDCLVRNKSVEQWFSFNKCSYQKGVTK